MRAHLGCPSLAAAVFCTPACATCVRLCAHKRPSPRGSRAGTVFVVAAASTEIARWTVCLWGRFSRPQKSSKDLASAPGLLSLNKDMDNVSDKANKYTKLHEEGALCRASQNRGGADPGRPRRPRLRSSARRVCVRVCACVGEGGGA